MPSVDGGASRLTTATSRTSPANPTAASAAGSRSFFNVSGMGVQRSRIGLLLFRRKTSTLPSVIEVAVVPRRTGEPSRRKTVDPSGNRGLSVIQPRAYPTPCLSNPLRRVTRGDAEGTALCGGHRYAAHGSESHSLFCDTYSA